MLFSQINKIFLNIKSKIFREIRLVIFLILLFLTAIFIYLTLISKPPPQLSDLLVNLLAGSIWSIITIFVIDYLTNKDRSNKLIAINKITHYGLLVILRKYMFSIMLDFGYIDKKDYSKYMDTMEDKFSEFLNDSKIQNILENIVNLTKDTMSLLIKVNKTLNKFYEAIDLGLKEFKPFPDPDLLNKIIYHFSPLAGGVSVGEDIIKFYFEEMPKKISKFEIKKGKEGFQALWKIMSGGFFNKKNSYKDYYLSSFKFILELTERAKKENIFIDI